MKEHPLLDFRGYDFHFILELPELYHVHDFTKGAEISPLEYSIGRYDENRKGLYESELFEGKRTHHVGIDIGGPVGTPIYAFYDGTIFHRVIPGFMIQGGDPNSKSEDRSSHGTGGPGYTIKAEFNDTPHDRGVLSMARSQDPNSAGSQFFIVVKDSHFLDGQYTAFGRVISGMDVADKIVDSPRDPRDNPNDRIEMKSVKIVNR